MSSVKRWRVFKKGAKAPFDAIAYYTKQRAEDMAKELTRVLKDQFIAARY